MRRRWMRLVVAGLAGLLALGVGGLAYALLWGKLLPYSPIVLGFEERARPHVRLFVEDGSPPRDLDWVDALPAEVEAFHGLRFQAPPKLFFFADRASYARRSLSKARMCAFYNGAIVVAPWTLEEDAAGTLSVRIYLVHELSHSLLYQNMGLRAALDYPRWLLEGLAMHSAGQMGTGFYPSRDETRALVAGGAWLPPALFGTDAEEAVPLAVPRRPAFLYSEFGSLVADLDERFGRARLLRYVTRLLDERDHDAVFREVFGIGFEAFLEDFRARAVGGREEAGGAPAATPPPVAMTSLGPPTHPGH